MTTPSQGATRGPSHLFLNLLRIGAGTLFWFHGAQKLLAMFGAEEARSFPEMLWWAGVLEFFGGILLVLGLFTRPVAFVLTLLMLAAYGIAHMPRDLWPVVNNGELALLYALVFAFLASNGGGRFSVDGLLAGMRRTKAAS